MFRSYFLFVESYGIAVCEVIEGIVP